MDFEERLQDGFRKYGKTTGGIICSLVPGTVLSDFTVLAAAHGFRWAEPDSVFVHEILSGGDISQENILQKVISAFVKKNAREVGLPERRAARGLESECADSSKEVLPSPL